MSVKSVPSIIFTFSFLPLIQSTWANPPELAELTPRMMEATESLYRERSFQPILPTNFEEPNNQPVIPPPPAPVVIQEETVLVSTTPHIPRPPELIDFEDSFDRDAMRQLYEGIKQQRLAGHSDYAPKRAYVVDPSQQKLTLVEMETGRAELTIPVGTGKNGMGFGSAQTPIGFFTMGGVRIAENANAYIQTGDSKTGVSGVYAEILYPPSYHESSKQGKVPNNVIIHGFNPSASQMLRERHSKKMIGRIPCTTGCPVPGMKDLPKLAPFLKGSAGKFDPTANPNSRLRSLIRSGKVVQYSRSDRLGDPILILDRPFQR